MKFNRVKKLIGVSLLFATSYVAANQEQPPLNVVVDDVIEQNVAKRIWVTGTVISRNDAKVAAEVQGRIEWLAEVGDRFKAGDVIAQIDKQELEFRHAENQATVKRLIARVDLLNKRVARLKKIEKTQSTSEESMDEALSLKAMSEQDLALAKIDLKRSQYLLSLSDLKAPFDGTVVERIQQLGEYNLVGQDLLRIVNTQSKEASVKAPLSVAEFVSTNQFVEIKNQQNSALAKVRAVVPVGDERSRMMEIRIALEGDKWPLGGAVRAALSEGGETTATTVHRDALVLRNSKVFVYKVDGDVAKRVEVYTGIGSGEMIEVDGDIANGDMVVVRGAEQLRDGQKVKFDQKTDELISLAR